MPPRLLVLPSPLLGPSCYGPVADELTVQGMPTTVATIPRDDLRPTAILDSFVEQARAARAEALLAHSNAGYYAPEVAARADVPVTLFMDAALPEPGADSTLLAPMAFRELIDALPVADGAFPPWTRWWPPESVEPLFPSAVWLERVTREAPRMRPDYFATPIPVPDAWARGSAAYLAFGKGYTEEASLARLLGWPTTRLPAHHLHHLSHPDATAATLLALHARLVRQAR